MAEPIPPSQDEWLAPWLSIIASTAHHQPVLELGCGDGHDTMQLSAAGLSVVGVELSEQELTKARQRIPRALFYQQDLRKPFPPEAQQTRVIVASLCLHYFPWEETRKIVARLHATLPSGSLLLCRLNSTNDHHFGASGHPEIEPYYYDVNGAPKRFFNEDSAELLFDKGWEFLSIREYASYKYSEPKWLWELILRKG